jgi:hypothetical protein
MATAFAQLLCQPMAFYAFNQLPLRCSPFVFIFGA